MVRDDLHYIYHLKSIDNFWPNIQCILGNIPDALEKNVYAIGVWSVLHVSVRFSCFIILFKSIFYLSSV